MAEIGEEIVGMIRGCIKTVTCGKKLSRNGKNNDQNKHLPVYTKVAYILGLRVSPSHRYFIVIINQQCTDFFFTKMALIVVLIDGSMSFLQEDGYRFEASDENRRMVQRNRS